MINAIWKMPISLDVLDERSANTLISHLGITFTEIGDDYLIAKMPVDERTHQPIGLLHGGASCVLAETVGSTAANFCVDFSKNYCVGLDINTNHVRSIRSGFVYGKAFPYHIGSTTHVWSIENRDEKGTLIAISRLTMAVLNKSGMSALK